MTPETEKTIAGLNDVHKELYNIGRSKLVLEKVVDAIDELRKLSSEVPRWIPVGERLPAATYLYERIIEMDENDRERAMKSITRSAAEAVKHGK